MSEFGWRIDLRMIVSEAVRKKCEAAVGDAAEFLLEEANRTVPIEEATLTRSGTVSQEGLNAVVSYDTPYAARQHEELDWRHDEGRRAKWLELTFKEQRDRVIKFLADKVGF